MLYISQLSSGEYITLIANYHKLSSDDRYMKLKQRGFSDEQIESAMKDNSFRSIKSLNITFTKPVSLYCSDFGYYNSIYSAYLKGHLPYTGSYVDQPAKVIDVFQTFDALYSETSKKDYDERMKEIKGLNRRGK